MDKRGITAGDSWGGGGGRCGVRAPEPCGPLEARPRPLLCRPEPGMDGAEQQRIKSLKNQTVPNQGYSKSTPSKQNLSEINEVLREKGIEKLIVTGFNCEQFTDSDRLKDNASFIIPFFKRSFKEHYFLQGGGLYHELNSIRTC